MFIFFTLIKFWILSLWEGSYLFLNTWLYFLYCLSLSDNYIFFVQHEWNDDDEWILQHGALALSWPSLMNVRAFKCPTVSPQAESAERTLAHCLSGECSRRLVGVVADLKRLLGLGSTLFNDVHLLINPAFPGTGLGPRGLRMLPGHELHHPWGLPAMSSLSGESPLSYYSLSSACALTGVTEIWGKSSF